MDVGEFLGLLHGVRPSGKRRWAARCPCRNDDQNPSLSVALGDKDQILLKCHRGGGCDLDAICEAMELKKSDLWPDSDSSGERKPVEVPLLPREKLTHVASYRYRNENGDVLYEKRRYVDESGRKTFRTRHLGEDGQWVWNMGGADRAVLYRLPEVLAQSRAGGEVYVVEGEKDVDILVSDGYVATTSPHGAGVWDQKFTDALIGVSEVFVIADADQAGRDHAAMVLGELKAAGVPASGWEPPGPLNDVGDLYGAGLTLADLVPLGSSPEPAKETGPVDGGVNVSTFDRPDPGVRRWDVFVDAGDTSYEWLIPGVLERGERVIVVAAEGVGKTYLARQVAICTAGGIQPFTQSAMPPIRTLTVDLENPERIIRRTTRELLTKIQTVSRLPEINAYLWTVPAGLDLLDPQDRQRLEEAIQQAKPDLILLGPLYKAFVDPGVRSSDQVAIELAKYLDWVRNRFGCALWLEHHAPLGSSSASRDLRPFGSSVWSRWPEFGLALSVDPTGEEAWTYNLRHFRGPRDERHWPTKLKRGKHLPFETIEFHPFTP